MGILNNSNAISVDSGYDITDSLRFRSSASASLTRTYGTPTSAKIFTLSMWVKRGKLGSLQQLYSGFTDSTNRGFIAFQSGDFIAGYVRNSGGDLYEFSTSALFRDTSAWYHIVVAFDTTQGTATNRVKVYVNGVQHTLTLTTTTQDVDLSLNTSGSGKAIGQSNSIEYFDGYMTEINFVDGQQLTPTSFGEYDDDTGVWKPKRYSGSYGTNGFYLKGRGTDNSGNGNNWTENNIDTSSGDATYDLMSDVPTLTDEDTSNFATLNPNNAGTNSDVTNGNLKIANASSHSTIYPTNMPTTGKYYFECKMAVHAAAGGLGFRTDTNKAESAYAEEANKYFLYLNNSNAYIVSETSNVALGSNLNSGTATFQVAIDFDAAEYYFGVNNTWYSSSWATTGNPATGANPTYNLTDGTKMFPFLHTGGLTWTVNFGQQPFAYTPPTGFKKINTFNLPDSTIKDGSQHFDILTWSGNGAVDRGITGLEFQPDFTWIKSRGNAVNHWLMNSVNGARKGISSNNTGAEQAFDQANYDFESFDSNGFSVSPPYYAHVNTSGHTFVGWNWLAGGSSSSNTDGTITSTVSANPTAGFSVVTYTGTGSTTATIGHGLGVAPKMIILKSRSASSTYWLVGHDSIGWTKGLYLNATNAEATYTPYWNNTAPTSSVFTLGNWGVDSNGSGSTYVAYCFAEVEGYSKFDKYTGNGSADGPFVYTGFRPAFVMFKVTSEANSWVIYDAARNTFNEMTSQLYPNLSNAEATSSSYAIDTNANGFKIRTSNGIINVSSGTFIYMAFAENPFKNSNAR